MGPGTPEYRIRLGMSSAQMSWAQSRKKSGVLVKKAVGMPGEPGKPFANGTMITNPVCGIAHCGEEKMS